MTTLPMALRPSMVGFAFFSTPWYVSQLNLAFSGPLPDFQASVGHLQQLANNDCMLMSPSLTFHVGRAACFDSTFPWQRFSGVGQQHRLAGVLCCPHIWSESCRCEQARRH